MASPAYIEQQLRGFYPTNPKINSVYLEEMFLAFDHLDDSDFETALKKHRATKKGDWPPLASVMAEGLGNANYSIGRLSNLFFHSLVQHGWHDGVRRGLIYDLGYSPDVNEAIRNWLVQCGINLNSPEYFGLPDWQAQYLSMLHNGDITEAHRFVGECGPDEIRYKYKRAADFYENMGDVISRNYFCYFSQQKLKIKVEGLNYKQSG